MARIKLSPEEGLHKMQPQTGAIPGVEFHLHGDGQVELCMFCRSGATKGKWHSRVGTAEEMLGFLSNLQRVANAGTRGPKDALEELEKFFGWEWDGQSPADPPSPANNLSLEDLGL